MRYIGQENYWAQKSAHWFCQGEKHNPPDPTSRGAQFQPHHHPASSALLPNPPMLPLNATNPLPPPPAIAAVPSPQPNGPPILPLPSPTSQFLLPSPNDYMNFNFVLVPQLYLFLK